MLTYDEYVELMNDVKEHADLVTASIDDMTTADDLEAIASDLETLSAICDNASYQVGQTVDELGDMEHYEFDSIWETWG